MILLFLFFLLTSGEKEPLPNCRITFPPYDQSYLDLVANTTELYTIRPSLDQWSDIKVGTKIYMRLRNHYHLDDLQIFWVNKIFPSLNQQNIVEIENMYNKNITDLDLNDWLNLGYPSYQLVGDKRTTSLFECNFMIDTYIWYPGIQIFYPVFYWPGDFYNHYQEEYLPISANNSFPILINPSKMKKQCPFRTTYSINHLLPTRQTEQTNKNTLAWNCSTIDYLPYSRNMCQYYSGGNLKLLNYNFTIQNNEKLLQIPICDDKWSYDNYILFVVVLVVSCIICMTLMIGMVYLIRWYRRRREVNYHLESGYQRISQDDQSEQNNQSDQNDVEEVTVSIAN